MKKMYIPFITSDNGFIIKHVTHFIRFEKSITSKMKFSVIMKKRIMRGGGGKEDGKGD